VVKVIKNGFSVSLVPYTLQHTTFHRKKVGDVFNVEFDILAKYLKSLMGKK
jgi:riboflavin synthase